MKSDRLASGQKAGVSGYVYLSSLGHTWWAHFEAMITRYEAVDEGGAEAAKT